MNIKIDGKATSQALSDTWHGLLGVARDLASSTTQDLDALAAEVLPHVAALTNESMSADAAAAAAARRALAQVEGIVTSEIQRLGLHDLAAFSAKLATGVQTAVSWLGVLVKAVVL